MVASRKDLTVAEAMQNQYALVDWGTAFTITHARLFPDMPTPRLRVGLSRIARKYLLALGGAAYLAEPMIVEHLRAGRLFRVAEAPVIERSVYAIYAQNGLQRPLVERALVMLPITSRRSSDSRRNQRSV